MMRDGCELLLFLVAALECPMAGRPDLTENHHLVRLLLFLSGLASQQKISAKRMKVVNGYVSGASAFIGLSVTLVHRQTLL